MELTLEKRIKFLELVAQMAGNSTFERVLGIDANEVAKYKKLLDVETQDEARQLAKKLRRANEEGREARIIEQSKRAREAADIANKRLAELESKRNQEKPIKKYDSVAIKKEDAERQRRLEKEQRVEEPDEVWNLLLEGSRHQRDEEIQRFKRNIENHGLGFCRKKYNATTNQIRFEADRLGLDIDWDRVRR